jgi:hypothetical protein
MNIFADLTISKRQKFSAVADMGLSRRETLFCFNLLLLLASFVLYLINLLCCDSCTKEKLRVHRAVNYIFLPKFQASNGGKNRRKHCLEQAYVPYQTILLRNHCRTRGPSLFTTFRTNFNKALHRESFFGKLSKVLGNGKLSWAYTSDMLFGAHCQCQNKRGE